MICKICGASLEDNAVFCNKCGASLNEAPATQPASTGFDFSNPVQPKKKPRMPKAFIAIGIVVVVALIALWAVGNPGFFVKAFGSDADYFKLCRKACI